MSDTKISEAAVEAAAYAIPASVPTFDRAKEVARNAISAAIPHLHPQPAELALDVEAMLTACVPGGSIVDPQVVADNIRAWATERKPAKPEAVRLRDKLRERAEFEAQVSIPRYGLDYTELNLTRITPDWRGEYVLFADHLAALAANGKQQVGDGIAETLEGVKAKLHPVEWSILMAGLSDARTAEQVGEVQGSND